MRPGNRRREGTRRKPDGFAVAGAGFLASMVAAQVTSGVGAEPMRWINPVAVAVAWSGMGLAAHAVAAVLVPDRRPVRRIAVGALAFAVVFEPTDPVVAVTGGTAMGAFAVPATVLAVRRRATGTGARRS
ncbi:hypothetical protein ACQPZ8_33260 [Actinomadura nitritigenes]|uniref:hypothetical protein n=1 Tax=Actinomadura nitritigenes TaxID=134602 RepID=UPI003D91E38F